MESVLLTPLRESLMAVDSKRSEGLRTYGDAVNVLLRACATDEVIAKASNDVANLLQSFAMAKKTYCRKLWDKSLHCKTVLSNKRLKSLFIDMLLPRSRQKTVSSLPLMSGWTTAPVFEKLML